MWPCLIFVIVIIPYFINFLIGQIFFISICDHKIIYRTLIRGWAINLFYRVNRLLCNPIDNHIYRKILPCTRPRIIAISIINHCDLTSFGNIRDSSVSGLYFDLCYLPARCSVLVRVSKYFIYYNRLIRILVNSSNFQLNGDWLAVSFKIIIVTFPTFRNRLFQRTWGFIICDNYFSIF